MNMLTTNPVKEALALAQPLTRVGFRQLSLVPLTWRDQNGWPRLVIFGLDLQPFEITTGVVGKNYENIRIQGWIEDHVVRIEKKRGIKTTIRYEKRTLPKPIQECYSDVIDKIVNLSKIERVYKNGFIQWLGCRIVCEINGLMPHYIKNKVLEMEDLFKEIYIIAEPSSMRIVRSEMNVQVFSYDNDPLLVSWDKGKLWLIDSFDMTPSEKYAKQEFVE
jgi:hypothetical protein